MFRFSKYWAAGIVAMLAGIAITLLSIVLFIPWTVPIALFLLVGIVVFAVGLLIAGIEVVETRELGTTLKEEFEQSDASHARSHYSTAAMTVITLAIVLLMALSFYGLAIYTQGLPCYGCGGKPATLFLAGASPTTTVCGTTVSALYVESVSITSTYSTITTNMLGLKILPEAGGPVVPNVAPPAGGLACPASGGFYVALESTAGSVMACWSNGTASKAYAWSSPISGTCATPVGAILSSAITISGGERFVVCMYGSGVVPPMAGAYMMQAYGLGGTTVSGQVDL
jgi:hypothetical protein